jgi:tripartite-type tricarboxylate transporter receptor subunit TctC
VEEPSTASKADKGRRGRIHKKSGPSQGKIKVFFKIAGGLVAIGTPIDAQDTLGLHRQGYLMDFRRRRFLFLTASAVALPTIAGIARAQTYPARPVRVIVPFSPGGPTDVFARIVAVNLSRSLGHQFYIENQPGAGGNLGMGAGARAASDGYTIMVVSTSYIVNPSLYPKIPYDPFKDFAPVTLAAATPNVLLVHPSIPASNVEELIAFLKVNNGKYSYAHSGIGTTSHLSGEMFKHSQDLDLVSVPFTGAAPAVQSALAGHTPIAFTVLTPALPQVKEGRLRALAVTTPKRTSALPGVPTIAEAGLPGQESDTISGVLVPAHTPQPIIELLHHEIGKAMIEPDAAQKLTSLGFDTIDSTPEEFSSRIQTEIPKWAKVIQTAGIKAE